MPTTRGRSTIWVIDDSTTDAQRVASTLRDEFDIKIFQDGAQALEQLSSSALPDLMLIDWVMPGMSGLEVCAYIRSARLPISKLPIILLTAQHGPSEIAQAFRNGANDYVVKPFVEEELKARVRTLINSRRNLEVTEALVRDLKKTEERLLLATSSAGVGIWEWDIITHNITTTDIHSKIFEFKLDQKITLDNLLDKVVSEDREKVRASLVSAIENKTDYSSEFRILKQNGSTAWILGHGRGVYDENENALRMVGIHLDISTQKKTELELLRAKEAAERATQMKSAFLANMSHEIRTPLGAMLGFAHLMQDPMISAMELSHYIEVLTRNGEQLSTIINDILDLSKVEAGLLTYEHREFNPSEVCNDVLSLFKAKAKDKKISLECICDPSTPSLVVTDPARLRQIVTNLVGNSMKFTRVGGITIKTSGITSDDGSRFLNIEVKDTGIGVPEEHSERIFEMFVQGDNSTTRKFGGTGIGLSLSRQLARELGGDLELVQSQQNAGSTFKVFVKDLQKKAAAIDSSQDNISTPNSSKVTLNGVRILVVDDSPDNQSLLNLFLSKRGASVDIATNGMEGYLKALRNSYDVVLMDLQMPQMDGYTTTRRLRDEGYEKPIIALTAHAMSEISAKCVEAGCSGFLPKPINPQELVATIASHTR